IWSKQTDRPQNSSTVRLAAPGRSTAVHLFGGQPRGRGQRKCPPTGRCDRRVRRPSSTGKPATDSRSERRQMPADTPDARYTAEFDHADVVMQVDTVQGDLHLHTQASQPHAFSHQLPKPPSWLAGRDAELARLTEAFISGTTPVVVLEGAGGVGKSALALYWACQNLDSFPDGQLYADLGGFASRGTSAAALPILQGF